MDDTWKSLSYFPGCSLATTAKENNASLKHFLNHFGIGLIPTEDWNCCGSSSAHSIDSDLAFYLAARNLFAAPPERPLLVACPGCYLRLGQTRIELAESREKRVICEDLFERPYPKDLEMFHFFDLLAEMESTGLFKQMTERLNGLKIAPYYGCMLARPPAMTRERNHHGLIEKIMSPLGAAPVQWPFFSRCCGTFLSVTRPRVAARLVNGIMQGAVASGAECIVTACAMCHLNLEIRCGKANRLPVFHFSEVLSLAMGEPVTGDWFKRHLIDPRPILEKRDLMTSRG